MGRGKRFKKKKIKDDLVHHLFFKNINPMTSLPCLKLSRASSFPLAKSSPWAHSAVGGAPSFPCRCSQLYLDFSTKLSPGLTQRSHSLRSWDALPAVTCQGLAQMSPTLITPRSIRQPLPPSYLFLSEK